MFQTPRFRPAQNGAINYRSNTPIGPEQLQKIAPSVFADRAHDSRSEKYQYIPTIDIVRALTREGFQPFSVQQGGSRDEDKRGFTKHLIKFRHEGEQQVLNGMHHEICLLNSHDGTSSYQLFSGIFRLVCLNGMVAQEAEIANVRVRHSGDIVSQVVEGSHAVLENTRLLGGRIEEMQGIILSPPEKLAFARAALVAKYGENPEEAPIRAGQLLEIQRYADEGDDLWTTLNVVQEHLVKGGDRYTTYDAQGRVKARRQTREIRSVDGNLATNRALWALAAEMSKLKAA